MLLIACEPGNTQVDHGSSKSLLEIDETIVQGQAHKDVNGNASQADGNTQEVDHESSKPLREIEEIKGHGQEDVNVNASQINGIQ
eukprot:c16191_g1_i2 orf=433-687(-)